MGKENMTHVMVEGKWIPTVDALLKRYPGSKLISNWDQMKHEMSQESDTYILKRLEEGSGFLERKIQDLIYRDGEPHPLGSQSLYYLGSYTFNSDQYLYYTELFQACGFNIVIDDKDKNEPGRMYCTVSVSNE